ncbi:amidohydrolase family protein [Nonomuraea sp. NPDC004580]|uniref:amidohydrolase family protein n=1 Tax=Nonomuraea sp. NPDC004580 TaxID=3154552 RepID=UPI0033AC6139
MLDRHPGLKLLAAHGGGYLPYYLGRSDHGHRVRPDARGCARPPSSYLRDLHFDSLTHDPAALREPVRVAGPERVLLGSDFPSTWAIPTRSRPCARPATTRCRRRHSRRRCSPGDYVRLPRGRRTGSTGTACGRARCRRTPRGTARGPPARTAAR